MGNNRTFYGVYYNSGDPGSENPKREKKDYASISLRLDIPPVFSDERVTLKDGAHYGLVAFYPVPSVATLNCRVGRRKFFELTPPQVINIYTESHLVDPQRDFFSNPQDTFTFSSGFVTGHKYAAQSPAKTIVDTVTAPVRALMPSVTITTNTQVQTGGGKPNQTTHYDQYTNRTAQGAVNFPNNTIFTVIMMGQRSSALRGRPLSRLAPRAQGEGGV